MIVPMTHVEPPSASVTMTRRPVPGVLAHSLGVPALHLMLARGRQMAVHPVEWNIQATPDIPRGVSATLPASCEQVVRVLLVPGYRATALGVSLVYQADPGASVDLALYTTGGALRSSAPVTLSTANGGLVQAPRVTEYQYLTPAYTYPIWTSDTGSTRSTAATLRAVDITGATLGTVHELRVTPSTGAGTRIRVLSVGVYELLDGEVAL